MKFCVAHSWSLATRSGGSIDPYTDSDVRRTKMKRHQYSLPLTRHSKIEISISNFGQVQNRL
jgi:hypothetical protein